MVQIDPDETDGRPWQPTLDGLTLPAQAQASGLELAAITTLRRLDELGMLDDADALTAQLILELARAVGAGVRNGRASAVAMAAKELREAFASLPAVPRQSDGFDALVAALAAADSDR